MRTAIVACAVIACLSGCAGQKEALSPQEEQSWQQFLGQQLAEGMVQPSSEDATAVAAIGDKVVPYVEENLGKAFRDPAGKGDYWLIIVLARTGTPRAAEGVVKALKHDYPGAIGRDRETAAKALVWLGAREAAPALREAIADHEKRIAEKIAEGASEGAQRAYAEEVSNLRACLQQLEQGTGKRDTRNFPFD